MSAAFGMTHIIENGILRIPLFHGTASLFVDSIEEFGLGAIDPVKDFGAYSFLKKVFDCCDASFAEDQEWEAFRGLNRHGSAKREDTFGFTRHCPSYFLQPPMTI